MIANHKARKYGRSFTGDEWFFRATLFVLIATALCAVAITMFSQ
jgi:hypothetical protein